MSAEDLYCLSTMGLQDLLGLSVLVRAFRLVRVPWNADEADDTDERGGSALPVHDGPSRTSSACPCSSANSASSVFHALV